MDLSGGRLDGLPFSFRLRSRAIRILRCLFAVLFYSLLYDAVRNCQHFVHKSRERLELGGMFHTSPSYLYWISGAFSFFGFNRRFKSECIAANKFGPRPSTS